MLNEGFCLTGFNVCRSPTILIWQHEKTLNNRTSMSTKVKLMNKLQLHTRVFRPDEHLHGHVNLALTDMFDTSINSYVCQGAMPLEYLSCCM